jgi:hypothetical protein
MQLTVTSVDGTVAEFSPQWEYYPNGNSSEGSAEEVQ